MLPMLVSVLGKTLMNLGMKLLSEALLEELILFGLRKLAESSKTKVDDKLLAMVESHLDSDKE